MEREIEYTIDRWKDKDGKFYTDEEVNASKDIANTWEPVEIYLVVTYNGEWVDNGIGPYEYWGFKGVDHDWEYEVEDINSATDEDGEEWKDRLTEQEYEAIIRACEDDGRECSMDDGPDYDDDDREPPYWPSNW